MAIALALAAKIGIAVPLAAMDAIAVGLAATEFIAVELATTKFIFVELAATAFIPDPELKSVLMVGSFARIFSIVGDELDPPLPEKN